MLIPDKIELEFGHCDSNSVYMSELMDRAKNMGAQKNNEFYNDNVRAIDLNQDGICEYILKYYDGGPNTIEEIYEIEDNKLHQIYFGWENSFKWAERSDNGYARMINHYYTGHKTNPIWKFSILEYDGERYSGAYSPELTYGQMRDFGLKEYKLKNYEVAEIYFRNILKLYSFRNPTTDLNNLALVLIKQDKLEDAKNLLFEELKKRKSPDTFYNLSIIFKKQHDKENELKYIEESNRLKQSTFKKNRIAELKNKLNNSR